MDWAGLATRKESTLIQGIAQSGISAGKLIDVSVNGTTVSVRAVRDLSAAAGDVLLLGRVNGQLLAVARLFAAAPAAPDPDQAAPPPKPQPETVYGKLICAPNETRSYRYSGYTGWRTDNDDVYQGQYGGNGLHIGCAFYGDKPRSLKGATVTSASIRAKRLSGGDYASRSTTLRRITNRKKPSGAPTLVSGSDDGPRLAIDKSDTSISIPAAYAQSLVDGSAGGLAIYESDGDPYVRLAGRSEWSQSWTLTINWKRTT